MPPITKGQKIQGSERTLANGAVIARFRAVKSDGTPTEVTRIVSSTGSAAAAARAAPRAGPKSITAAQAQAAFDRFYSRADHKGYASMRGQKSARTYDLNHTTGTPIADSRYLRNPSRWDFQGVDTGAAVRKTLSERQLANLAAGRAAGRAARGSASSGSRSPSPKCAKGCVPAAGQVAGYWW